jgi:RNA polymerase sigma-70 factor (ECF subfamily)
MVQQVFVHAYQKLDKYEPGRNFSTWLRTVACNLVRDEMRKAAFEHRCHEDYRRYVATVADASKTEDEHIVQMEEAVADCRRRLQPAADRALTLRYGEALSLDAVAARLGRTLAATRQLLFRAREALRACVQHALEERQR